MLKLLVFQPPTSLYGVKRKELFARNVVSYSGFLLTAAIFTLFCLALVSEGDTIWVIIWASATAALGFATLVGFVSGVVMGNVFSSQAEVFRQEAAAKAEKHQADERAFHSHWQGKLKARKKAILDAHPNWHPNELVVELEMEDLEDEYWRAKEARKNKREAVEHAEKVKYNLHYLY